MNKKLHDIFVNICYAFAFLLMFLLPVFMITVAIWTTTGDRVFYRSMTLLFEPALWIITILIATIGGVAVYHDDDGNDGEEDSNNS